LVTSGAPIRVHPRLSAAKDTCFGTATDVGRNENANAIALPGQEQAVAIDPEPR
jgi:hypothetical protein